MNKKDYKKQIQDNALYFISQNNMNNSILKPRVPNNYFTQNGYEDNTTDRVCFAPSIDKALMALSQNCNGKEFYIHVPTDKDIRLKKPTVSEVPDSKITGETWSLDPTKIKCIGKVRVIGDDGKDGTVFDYGKNKGELYGWNYEWLKNKK